MAEETSTALVGPTHRPTSMVRSYDQARGFAKAYAISGLKSSKGGAVEVRAAEALVKIEAGAELGIGPMAAITAFHVIEGKPALSATGWAALVDGSDVYDYEVTAHTDEVCEIQFFKSGKRRGASTFTIGDAKRAGLVRQGGNWEKYPKAMLFARAFTAGARAYCPAIGMGMAIYDPDELEVVAGNAHVPTQEAGPPEPEEIDAEFTEPAPNRHEEGAKAAGEREARRALVAAWAREVEALQTQEEIAAWCDANEDRVHELPDRSADAFWSYTDAMQCHRAGQAYRPAYGSALADALEVRQLAALPAIDFANPGTISDRAMEPDLDDEGDR